MSESSDCFLCPNEGCDQELSWARELHLEPPIKLDKISDDQLLCSQCSESFSFGGMALRSITPQVEMPHE